MTKAQLRAQYKATRNAIPAEAQARASQRICSAVAALDTYRRAEILLLYAKTGSEVDLLPLFEQAKKDGIPCAFPRCISKGIMEFYHVDTLAELAEGAFGIMEPRADRPPVTDLSGALMLVPAIAYDADGYRLGYGGGYYDRFLAAHPTLKTVGVTYAACLTSTLPRGEFDKAVNTVITEND